MKTNRIRAAVPRMAIALALAMTGARATHAAEPEPAGAALVIGAATYSALPGLAACARSANLMSAALKNLGFEVTERVDASSGAIDAGIGEFTARVAAGRHAAFVYVCGYGASFTDRQFVLPVTARIARPSDLLTQGILVKTLLNTLAREGTAGIAVLDLFPRPGETAALGVDALIALPLPDGVGVVAAAGKPPGDAPTPIALAFAGALSGPVVRTDGAMNKAQEALAAASVPVSVRMPSSPGYLAGAPRPRPATPPPVAATPPAAPPVAAPVAAPVAPPEPATSPAATSPAAAPAGTFPDEDRMTDLDRREAQIALARLSYYKGPIDGVFGVATRAAIEKFQTGLGVTPNGRLTAAQVSRLVSGGR